MRARPPPCHDAEASCGWHTEMTGWFWFVGGACRRAVRRPAGPVHRQRTRPAARQAERVGQHHEEGKTDSQVRGGRPSGVVGTAGRDGGAEAARVESVCCAVSTADASRVALAMPVCRCWQQDQVCEVCGVAVAARDRGGRVRRTLLRPGEPLLLSTRQQAAWACLSLETKAWEGRASELMSPPSLPVYGSQVREKFPNEYKAREQDKLRYRYPRGESYMDVLSRCGHTRGSALAACQEPVD